MARLCLIAREAKRQKLVDQYAKKRKELKDNKDYDALQELPRNSMPIRLHKRCMLTGRARGNYRKFGISRLVFREMALRGEIPGIKKASW